MPEISVDQAVGDIAKGGMVIVVDDEDRENEGDLIMAAEKATPEAINFIVRHSSGIVCVPLTALRLEELHLPMMVRDNTARLSTAFTVSVDALEGTTTGVSAHDRWVTVQRLVAPDTRPEDLGRPGHVFPSSIHRWRRSRSRGSHGSGGRPFSNVGPRPLWCLV